MESLPQKKRSFKRRVFYERKETHNFAGAPCCAGACSDGSDADPDTDDGTPTTPSTETPSEGSATCNTCSDTCTVTENCTGNAQCTACGDCSCTDCDENTEVQATEINLDYIGSFLASIDGEISSSGTNGKWVFDGGQWNGTELTYTLAGSGKDDDNDALTADDVLTNVKELQTKGNGLVQINFGQANWKSGEAPSGKGEGATVQDGEIDVKVELVTDATGYTIDSEESALSDFETSGLTVTLVLQYGLVTSDENGWS